LSGRGASSEDDSSEDGKNAHGFLLVARKLSQSLFPNLGNIIHDFI